MRLVWENKIRMGAAFNLRTFFFELLRCWRASSQKFSLSKNSFTQGILCTVFVSYTRTIPQALFWSCLGLFLVLALFLGLLFVPQGMVAHMLSFWSTHNSCCPLKKSTATKPFAILNQRQAEKRKLLSLNS